MHRLLPHLRVVPPNVDEVPRQVSQDQKRVALVCTLLGLNPATEQRDFGTILDDFDAMPDGSKNTFLLGRAVNLLSSMGRPVGAAQLVVPMDTRPSFTGGTPGIRSFEKFPKF
jgi:hypothetical protein